MTELVRTFPVALWASPIHTWKRSTATAGGAINHQYPSYPAWICLLHPTSPFWRASESQAWREPATPGSTVDSDSRDQHHASRWVWRGIASIYAHVLCHFFKIHSCSTIVGYFLVGGWATPLKNMSSSIGMISNPIYGKIKNVPNHQPAFLFNDCGIFLYETTAECSMSQYEYQPLLWMLVSKSSSQGCNMTAVRLDSTHFPMLIMSTSLWKRWTRTRNQVFHIFLSMLTLGYGKLPGYMERSFQIFIPQSSQFFPSTTNSYYVLP